MKKKIDLFEYIMKTLAYIGMFLFITITGVIFLPIIIEKLPNRNFVYLVYALSVLLAGILVMHKFVDETFYFINKKGET